MNITQALESNLDLAKWNLARELGPKKQITVFGVRGDHFFLVKKNDPLLDRIWAAVLKFFGAVRTDEATIQRLYEEKSLYAKPQELPEVYVGLNEELDNLKAISKKYRAKLDETKKTPVTGQGQANTSIEDELEKEFQACREELRISHQVSIELEAKITKLKILEDRVEKLTNPSTPDFQKNLQEAFKASEDKFLEIFMEQIYFQDEQAPLLEHILKVYFEKNNADCVALFERMTKGI